MGYKRLRLAEEAEIISEDVGGVKLEERVSIYLGRDSSAPTETLLSENPLFIGCGNSFIERLAQRSRRVHLVAGQELKLETTGPCYIVEEGAVQVRVGEAPFVAMGPGTSFNEVAMLSLMHEAEELIESTQLVESATPYKMMTLPSRSTRQDSEADAGDENACVYNLCPCAVPEVQKMAREAWAEGWLPVLIRGGEQGATPISGGNSALFVQGGATLLSLTMQIILDVGRSDRSSLDCFHENVKRLSSRWRSILRHGKVCFPRVPPIITWSIAEVAMRKIVEVGQNLVAEADGSEDCESLYIIEAGTATVEKLAGGAQARDVQVGVLALGAVLGDMTFLGAGIPRVATCKARGSVEALCIPAKPLLMILRRFPGITQGCSKRLDAWGKELITRLEPEVFTLSSLVLFAERDQGLLNELALHGHRKVFHAGCTIKEEGSTEGTFYALEFGMCSIETRAKGIISVVPTGNCFGDRTLLGASKTANATVRVMTPLALVLALEQEVLAKALHKFPKEVVHFQKMKQLPDGRTMGNMVAHIQTFTDSCRTFIEEIAQCIQPQCYLPRQTLCVQGAQDQCQMFILKSGLVIVEKDKRKVCDLNIHSSFGELAMLGAVRRRTSTIRAMVFSFTLEIARSNFIAACEKFPEEKKRYEEDGMKNMDEETKVYWPSLGGCPERLQYLLSLYAERRVCPPQSQSLNQMRAQRSAMLIVSGQAAATDKDGYVDVLGAGECLNEQALISAVESDTLEVNILPVTPCEVQIISQEVWNKIIKEFDTALERVRPGIVRSLVAKSTRRWEKLFGYTICLQRSAFFRGTSEAFLTMLQEKLVNVIVDKGQMVFTRDSESHEIRLLLCGRARSEDPDYQQTFEDGAIFGEAGLVDLAALHAFSLEAETLCIMQVLHRTDFLECLEQFPVEAQRFSKLKAEAAKVVDQFHGSSLPKPKSSMGARGPEPAAPPTLTLKQKVHSTPAFRHCDPAFFKRLTSNLQDCFLSPNESVVSVKEKCVYGQTPMFLILAGKCYVRSPWGVILGVLEAGELFGEGGALGLVEERTCEVVAWPDGLAHCARIDGAAVKAALSQAHGEGDMLKELFQRRAATNQEYLEQREVWLWQTAIPALARSPLFGGCSDSFLHMLATPLLETSYAKGECIAVTGEVGESMQLLLQGEGVLESKTGVAVAPLGEGAAMGEINLLGLFHSRMATLRATTDCRVLEVTRQALRQALDVPEHEVARKAFDLLVASRKEQISRGLPLSALHLNVEHDNLFIRAVALLAERMDIESGEEWAALPDSDACGPHISVLAHGRAYVSTASGRRVITLVPGYLCVDGLVHAHGAHYKAERACEVYRFRRVDLLLAMMSIPSASEVFYKVRVHEKEAHQMLEARLNQVRGCSDGLAPHPADDKIMLWKYKRKEAMDYAHHLKTQNVDLDKLPRMMIWHWDKAPGDRSIKSRGGTGKMRSRQPSSGGKRAQGQNMRHISSAPSLAATAQAASRSPEGLSEWQGGRAATAPTGKAMVLPKL